MKWIVSEETNEIKSGLIEWDQDVGYYLYVVKKDGSNFDYLQDDFETAINQAQNQFGIPQNGWKKVEDY